MKDSEKSKKELIDELKKMRKQLEKIRGEKHLFNVLMNAIPDNIYFKDKKSRFILINQSLANWFGIKNPKEAIGLTDFEYFTKEHAQKAYEDEKEIMETGQPIMVEEKETWPDERETWVSTTKMVLKDRKGQILGTFGISKDITARKRVEAVVGQQAQEILELSTPVLKIWDGIVVAPLIGSLDSQRTQLFMERLLQTIVNTNSQIALLDITGVPTIDTQTAQHLVETIGAVKLLGAKVILTGVRPVIAQTLVHLGIDLSHIVTRSSLASGLHVAIEMLDDLVHETVVEED